MWKRKKAVHWQLQQQTAKRKKQKIPLISDATRSAERNCRERESMCGRVSRSLSKNPTHDRKRPKDGAKVRLFERIIFVLLPFLHLVRNSQANHLEHHALHQAHGQPASDRYARSRRTSESSPLTALLSRCRCHRRFGPVQARQPHDRTHHLGRHGRLRPSALPPDAAN